MPLEGLAERRRPWQSIQLRGEESFLYAVARMGKLWTHILCFCVSSGHSADCACLLPVDHATFHDKADALEQADVSKRIAWNRDDVGPEAGLQRANLILPAQ